MPKPPSFAEVSAHLHALLKPTVDHAREIFCLPSNWTTKMTVHDTLKRSNGGYQVEKGAHITMHVGHHTSYNSPYRGIFNEYPQYAGDPVIGQIASHDWRVGEHMILIHEIAHSVQYSLPLCDNGLALGRQRFYGLGLFEPGHGPFFQTVYARLRADLLNPLLPPGSIGGTKYRAKKPQLDAPQSPLVGMHAHHPERGLVEPISVNGKKMLLIKHDIVPSIIGMSVAQFEELSPAPRPEWRKMFHPSKRD